MNWKDKNNAQLIHAFLSLKTEEKMERFLRDLMTEKEIEEFGKRLEAASLLTKGVPYVEIEAQTGLSSTTVARVSKWLHGEHGGYRDVLKKIT
jgi:TrpR-related protein YerC/YecD